MSTTLKFPGSLLQSNQQSDRNIMEATCAISVTLEFLALELVVQEFFFVVCFFPSNFRINTSILVLVKNILVGSVFQISEEQDRDGVLGQIHLAFIPTVSTFSSASKSTDPLPRPA